MPGSRLNKLATIAVALLSFSDCTSGVAAQETYPDRPVRIIVPFAPAGPGDVMARLLAQKLSEDLGKQFYIENQPGAGGNIGMANAARAAPDGYTILVTSSALVVNPSLYEKLSYDPLKDFTPVSIAGVSPNVLVVHPSLPVNSVKELIEFIRSHPTTNNFATPGAGTTPHLSGELFRVSLGLDLIPVPFNGAAPALQSKVGGHTPIAFTALPPATPLIKDGKLRALAVTSSARSPVLPGVPTMAEAGLNEQEADTLQGVLVPAGTPQPIVDLLHREIVKIVEMPDVKERFAATGFDPVANTPAEFAAQMRVEVAKWGKVIKAAGIRLE